MRKIIALALLVAFFSGCERKSAIPVYLRIDDFKVETDFATEGTASSKITTVWVEVGNDIVGAYELPIVAPIIADGPTTITLRPGINLNGQLSLRNEYPYYQPIIQTLDLTPGSEVVMKSGNNTFPVTNYNSNYTILTLEDFEGAGVNFAPSPISDTSLRVTQDLDEIFKEDGLTEVNTKSGKVVVPIGPAIAEFQSINAYPFPRFIENVYLEVNYKCDIPILFGVIVNEGILTQKAPVVTVLPSEDWNKIYINLITEVGAYPSADNFNIFFGAANGDDTAEKTFYVDNLKLVY